MRIRTSILVIYIVVWCLFAGGMQILWAQRLDEACARQAATDFLRGRMKTAAKRTVSDLRLWRETRNGYVFTPSVGGGFVWIEGDADAPAVLGYSLEGEVRGTKIPDILACLMENGAGHRAVAPKRQVTPVPPLLSSVWNQDAPFNGLCPYYHYDNGTVSAAPCVVGCVATATSEVMRHYAYPEALLDTLHGWTTAHYELADVMPGTRIDWANIRNRYDGGYTEAEARAVQELSLYCGMACRMNYGPGSSGAQTYRLLEPLREVFGYSYVNFYDRSRYSPDGWRAMLHHELQRGVPLVYTAYNFEFVGHAFVVDGVDEDGLFHVRWGENTGFYDGYFDIDILNAYEWVDESTELGRILGFFCNQSALAFCPAPLDACPVDTLTYDEKDITVDAVRFLRQPDTNRYVQAEVDLANHSRDTICYTLLMFDTDTPDSIDWAKAESMAITAVTLYPGERTTTKMYCRFLRSGTCYVGLTGNQEHISYLEPVEVAQAEAPKLQIGPAELLSLSSDRVDFHVPIAHIAGGWAGSVVFYCLRCGDNPNFYEHWNMMDFGSGIWDDTVSFGCLEPDTEYTLDIRYPWEIVCSHTFRTLPADGLQDVSAGRDDTYHIYNLLGMPLETVTDPDDGLRRLPEGVYVVKSSGGTTKKVYKH